MAAGAPICDESRLAEVVQQFERDADKSGERVCWFASTTRLRKALEGTSSHTSVVIGAQPVWNPGHWEEIVRKNASLRAQIHRARNKGAAVSEWPPEHASGDAELQECLDDWTAHHPLPTLRFLTEPVTLDRLRDGRIFVAELNHTPVCFLITTPVLSRNGWLVEQIIRGRGAPNGASELPVDAAMRVLAAEGFEYITLGLVPLTHRARTGETASRLWLRMTLSLARWHGRRFYNFEGLDAFKAKFKPDAWEPLFALSNERHLSIRTLMAIVASFSRDALLPIAARALTAAAHQEAVSMRRRMRAKSAAK